MYFTHLKLINFRNYEKESVNFHEKINIVTGNNAQGKTNLLEALYITSLGKSFRTGKDAEMIGFGGDFAYVKSNFIKEGYERTIEISILKKGKIISIDGNKISKTKDMVDKAYIVAFTPDDLKIVKEEPERRRKFLDRELCQLSPIYYSNLQKYRRALLQRNFLLKKEKIDDDLMEVWEKNLAEYGSKLSLERAVFVEKLKKVGYKVHKDISGGKEDLEVYYEPSEISEEKLKEGRRLDKIKGITRSGPHRDDIGIKIDGIDVRKYGSQGQQRTAALSLKLSEIELIREEKNEAPVLLLDDVLSELDRERQQYLLNSTWDVQVFISTAERKNTIWEGINDKVVVEVKEGEIV